MNFFTDLKNALLYITLVILGIGVHSDNAKANDDLQLSGFARMVAGYYGQENTSLKGYRDRISVSEDSLIGVRADYSVSDKLELVGQAIFHTADYRDSGIQWLYADYQFTRSLSVKLGRQRLPLFTFSDVIDVGFAYPWITAPIATYSNFIFTEFDGALLRYDFSNQLLRGYAETYYGGFEGDIDLAPSSFSTDVDNIYGFVANVNLDKFTLRTSFQTGHTEISIPDLQELVIGLRSLGFERSAAVFSSNDTTRLFQLGINYEALDYFVRAEHTVIDSDAFLISRRRSSYVSVGINDYPFTYHATLSYGKSSYSEPPQEIPVGLDPMLDQLAFTYSMVVAALPIDQGQQYTVGVRYDLKSNIALKAEVTHLNGAQRSRGFLDTLPTSGERAKGSLYQVGIEWVF